ncbi:endonuclease domain-containing protein [Sphingomonas baiyangensis]
MPRVLRPEVSIARKLRRDMSYPEILLWQALCGSRARLRFRRQHPIGPYVIDFYAASARLCVEVDGEAHDRADRPARDIERDRFLRTNRYRLYRVPARDVLCDIDAVVRMIVASAAAPLHHAAHGPPPRAGEDER